MDDSNDVPPSEADAENPCVIVSSGSLTQGTIRRRRPGRRWSAKEDAVLTKLVEQYGNRHWKKIAHEFEAAAGSTRSDVQCLHRWNKCLRPGLIKGPWQDKEDKIIGDMIAKHGVNNIRWSVIAKMLPGRLGKQVRERWINHLDPSIIKTEWTKQEDALLRKLQGEYGNRWKWIAEMISGRSENGVKNRWHSIKPSALKSNTPKRAVKGIKRKRTTADYKQPNARVATIAKKEDNTPLFSIVKKGAIKREVGIPDSHPASELLKLAQHARTLLQMSENYTSKPNSSVQGNAAVSTLEVSGNGLRPSAIGLAPALQDISNKSKQAAKAKSLAEHSSTEVSSVLSVPPTAPMDPVQHNQEPLRPHFGMFHHGTNSSQVIATSEAL